MKVLARYFENVFTVDLRALALLRIGLGALLLLDLSIRASDLEAHYSNMGVLPLHVLHQFAWNPFHFSFHTLSGLWQVQALLFLTNAALAFGLLVGYQTRFMTIACWLFIISLQNRNPMILQGGDDLLRMLLFWGIFLPWHKFYSIDAANKPEKPGSTAYCSVATAAYIVQIALVYVCTALLKSSPEWHTEGTALYYALSLDQILMPGGRLLYPYPELLQFLTFSTYYGELLLPALLFIPFRNSFFRMLVVSLLLLFHLGISLTLFVGLFFLINWVSILGLLPPRFLDWLHPRLVRQVRRLEPLRARLPLITMPVSVDVKVQKPLVRKSAVGEVREAGLLLVLLYTCWWNFAGAGFGTMPDAARWFGYFFRVDQNWGMFAPAVFKDDGWYVLEGCTENDCFIDLNQNGQDANYVKPAAVVSLFKNDRWRKYSENYLFVHNSWMRPYYCNYLLRTWNEGHKGAPVKSLNVIYMKETTAPNYEPVKPKREVLCSCGEL